MQCLTTLYPYVTSSGLVILDDYYTWDGCARALHDYLSMHKIADRIEEWRNVCYLIKRSTVLPDVNLHVDSTSVKLNLADFL